MSTQIMRETSLRYNQEKVAWSIFERTRLFMKRKTLLKTSKEFGETEARCSRIDSGVGQRSLGRSRVKAGECSSFKDRIAPSRDDADWGKVGRPVKLG